MLNSHKLIVEILKNQMTILPITPLFELVDRIQLNNVSSEFESKNGVFICLHPITNKLTDGCVAVFNVNINNNTSVIYNNISEEEIAVAMLKRVPFTLEYNYESLDKKVKVKLTLYMTPRLVNFDYNYIPILLNNIFGEGRVYLSNINYSKGTNLTSKDILLSYTSDLMFEPVYSNNKLDIMYAILSDDNIMRRAFITSDKSTLCLFKEVHVLSTYPECAEYRASTEEIKKEINKLSSIGNPFDAIVIEAYKKDPDSDEGIIYTLIVNINIINDNILPGFIAYILSMYKIYKYNKIVGKKLTYLDIV